MGGVIGSCGWIHCASYQPHTMKFRRPLGTDPSTGASLTKVITVHFTWSGSNIHVSCTNMAGEEVFVQDMLATDKISLILDQVSWSFQLAQERLRLVLPSGNPLSDEGNQTLADITDQESSPRPK